MNSKLNKQTIKQITGGRVKQTLSFYVLFWFGLVLCHINYLGLFNAKFIFILINSSISNSTV